MTAQEYIRDSLKEAEIYRSQGLLTESKGKFQEALKFISKKQPLAVHKKLMTDIENKIVTIEKDLTAIGNAANPSQLSEKKQDLIKELFSSSENRETAMVEGAIALAKFGQHEQALLEFYRLLEQGIMPGIMAKNIICCHLALSSPKAAIEQFDQWNSRNLLSKKELKNIQEFLVKFLKKNGIPARLSGLSNVPSGKYKMDREEPCLEIISIIIPIKNVLNTFEEFETTLQAGNIISIIIPASRKDLVEIFQTEKYFENIQMYSPRAFIKASGKVAGKIKIEHGPNRGDYIVDINLYGI